MFLHVEKSPIVLFNLNKLFRIYLSLKTQTVESITIQSLSGRSSSLALNVYLEFDMFFQENTIGEISLVIGGRDLRKHIRNIFLLIHYKQVLFSRPSYQECICYKVLQCLNMRL